MYLNFVFSKFYFAKTSLNFTWIFSTLDSIVVVTIVKKKKFSIQANVVIRPGNEKMFWNRVFCKKKKKNDYFDYF